MSGARRTRRPSTRIQLSPKQANIYIWSWQKDARFRCAVCGRRFGNLSRRGGKNGDWRRRRCCQLSLNNGLPVCSRTLGSQIAL
jgi:transposase-like protein